MKTKLAILLAALWGGAFAFSSCEGPVALGKKLNLEPPEVSITSPDFMENITHTLVIKGTATDKEEVSCLFLTIEQVVKGGAPAGAPAPWTQEWEWRGARGGSWENLSAAPIPFDDWSAEWAPNGTLDGKMLYSWELIINMSDRDNGEYIISVNAENNVKNIGSIEQQRVIVDKDPPVVKVQAPILEFDDYDREESYDYDAEIAVKLGSYRLRNAAHLDMLHNKKIDIQYEVEDDFSIDTLSFQLAGRGYENYYYNAEGAAFDAGWSGKVEILAEDIRTGREMIDNEDGEPLFLQIISTAADLAGNTKTRSHGWLVWWPEADRPWTEGVGVEDRGDAETQARVYPGSDAQYQSFDNDGLYRVQYTLYASGNLNEPYSRDGVVFAGEFENEGIEGAPPSTFYSWSFKAPEECDDYKVVIECWDINDPPVKGKTTELWFYVYDINAPDIKLESPDEDAPLFGDSNGSVAIKGEASDGVNPVRLTVAWLNPLHPNAIESLINYQSSEFEGWNLTLGQGASPPVPVRDLEGADAGKGNLLWEIDISGEGTQDADTKRIKKPFEFAVSLWDELKIPQEVPLSGQTFIFRVAGGERGANSVAVLKSFRGDTDAPQVSAERVAIFKGGALDRFYTREYLAANNYMSSLIQGDELYIYGTWDDDSYAYWQDPSRMGAFTVTWNGQSLETRLNAAGGRGADTGVSHTEANADAALLDADSWGWVAGPLYVDQNQATRGGGFIEAFLLDPAGTPAVDGLSARVLTNVPFIMYISAVNENGAYNKDNEITVVLEFNKPVQFVGDAAPTLTMAARNGAGTEALKGGADYTDAEYIAAYNDSVYPRSVTNNNPWEDGKVDEHFSMTHTFTYTVRDGHNADRLTVRSINGIGESFNNFRTVEPVDADMTITGEKFRNLADAKTIKIDTIPPYITLVEALGFDSAINFVKAPRQIYMRVEFSEDINFARGAQDNAAVLYLNVDGTTAGLPVGVAPSASGTKALLFTYQVGSGHNALFEHGGLNATGFDPRSSVITDLAGNAATFDIPPYTASVPQTAAGGGANISNNVRLIIVDNTPPVVAPAIVPSINGMVADGVTNYKEAQRFTLNGNPAEGPISAFGASSQGATMQYTINGTDWINYHGEVTLSAAMDYKLQARHVDEVGNIGAASTPAIEFTIIVNLPLLTSAGGSPGGTYTRGDTIEVHLNLRGAVTVTPATNSMTLAVSGFTSGAATRSFGYNRTEGNTLVFNYTISNNENDNAAVLGFGTLNLGNAQISMGGTNINADLAAEFANRTTVTNPLPNDFLRLSTYTSIGIDTIAPVLIPPLGFNDATGILTLKFSKPIFKGDGDITITLPAANYRPPAVMEKADFQRWGGVAGSSNLSNLGYYYKVGVNGADDSGNVDTAERYILDYAINPADANTAGNAAQTVRNILTGAGANVVKVPVVSGAVTGSGTDTLTVALTAAWGYQLRVKGVTYTVSYDEGLVQDRLQLVAAPQSSLSLTIAGVNVPFIRVNKTREEIVTNGTVPIPTNASGTDTGVNTAGLTATASTPQARQFLTTNFKIDSQTPTATIRYGYARSTQERAIRTAFSTTPATTIPVYSRPAVSPPAAPANNASANTLGTYGNNANGGQYNSASTPTLGENNLEGYLYGITAIAYVGTTGTPAFAISREMVARSTVLFENVDNVPNWRVLRGLAEYSGNNKRLHLWIRGGDVASGDSLTPGFPLNWNWNASAGDYSGMRILTGNDTGRKFWVSWEVTAPTYFHFMGGVIPQNPPANGTSSLVDLNANGPEWWVWSKNQWAYRHEEFILYPGMSLQFSVGTVVQNPGSDGNFEFYNAYSEGRTSWPPTQQVWDLATLQAMPGGITLGTSGTGVSFDAATRTLTVNNPAGYPNFWFTFENAGISPSVGDTLVVTYSCYVQTPVSDVVVRVGANSNTNYAPARYPTLANTNTGDYTTTYTVPVVAGSITAGNPNTSGVTFSHNSNNGTGTYYVKILSVTIQ